MISKLPRIARHFVDPRRYVAAWHAFTAPAVLLTTLGTDRLGSIRPGALDLLVDDAWGGIDVTDHVLGTTAYAVADLREQLETDAQSRQLERDLDLSDERISREFP